MSARAYTLSFESDDLSTGGDYSAVQLGEHVGKIVAVEDYEPKEQGKYPGWKWTVQVAGADFYTWTSFSPKARWTIARLWQAAGFDLDAGEIELVPEALVGKSIGVEIDLQKEDASTIKIGGSSSPRYREIARIFPADEVDETNRWDADEPQGGTPNVAASSDDLRARFEAAQSTPRAHDEDVDGSVF